MRFLLFARSFRPPKRAACRIRLGSAWQAWPVAAAQRDRLRTGGAQCGSDVAPRERLIHAAHPICGSRAIRSLRSLSGELRIDVRLWSTFLVHRDVDIYHICAALSRFQQFSSRFHDEAGAPALPEIGCSVSKAVRRYFTINSCSRAEMSVDRYSAEKIEMPTPIP